MLSNPSRESQNCDSQEFFKTVNLPKYFIHKGPLPEVSERAKSPVIIIQSSHATIAG
jgi:hypothetical protein